MPAIRESYKKYIKQTLNEQGSNMGMKSLFMSGSQASIGSTSSQQHMGSSSKLGQTSPPSMMNKTRKLEESPSGFDFLKRQS